MHMQLHLASGYARPITAVKLDCRRLSPADRPNKTRIFSGITAVTPPSRARYDFDLVFYGVTIVTLVDIYARTLFADNVGQGNVRIPLYGQENM